MRSICLVLLMILVLVACRRETEPARTTTVPAPAAATATSGATAVPAAEEEEAPPATPEATATGASLADEPDLSPIFSTGWEDRSDYAAGLVADAQGVLGELPSASVYHMAFTIDDSLTHLSGRQEILYTNGEEEPLELLYLRLYPNLADGEAVLSDLRVDGEPVTPVYELQDSAVRLPLAQPLSPGEQALLSMAFEVEVPVAGGGNYGTFVFDDDILALAHFYPFVPVYDDEGWNVEIAPDHGDVIYADSSFYRVQVTAPEGLVMAASGVEVEREVSGAQQTVTYAAGPVRDFYLVASPHFERVSQTAGDTTLYSYSFPEHAAVANQVLDYAVAAVASFENHFGPYPFSELDIASTPTQALGVEYPGIFVNALRLYQSGGGNNQQYLEAVTAHETAHQWFYSVVGNDQVDEPWLDEALAQYATMRYYEDQYGEGGRQGFRASLEDRWDRVQRADVPVGQPVAAYEGASYSAIVYGRGPLFFEALEEEMGATAFADFLQAYYQDHRWDIATTDSLRQVAERSCGCDLGALFDEWIYAEE